MQIEILKFKKGNLIKFMHFQLEACNVSPGAQKLGAGSGFGLANFLSNFTQGWHLILENPGFLNSGRNYTGRLFYDNRFLKLI